MERRLYRSDRDKMLAGVCGGLGEYFDVDPTLVRILFVFLALATGVFVFAYILAWIIVPRREVVTGQPETDQSPPSPPPEPTGPRQYSSWTRYLPGLILVFIGVVLLFRETFYWFDLDQFWPVVLIIIGIALIVGRQSRIRARQEHLNSEQASTHNGGTAT